VSQFELGPGEHPRLAEKTERLVRSARTGVAAGRQYLDCLSGDEPVGPSAQIRLTATLSQPSPVTLQILPNEWRRVIAFVTQSRHRLFLDIYLLAVDQSALLVPTSSLGPMSKIAQFSN